MWDYMGMDLTDLAGSHTRKSLSPHEAKGAPITDVTLKWWQTNESIGKVHLEMTKLIRSR